MNGIPQSVWLEFLSLVTDTRALQSLYERTMDPIARREKRNLELRVDATISTFTHYLAAERCAEGGTQQEYEDAKAKLLESAAALFRTATVSVEGGAS